MAQRGWICATWTRACIGLSAGSVAAGQAAHAGAWTQAPGEGLQIATVAFERGDFGDSWSNGVLLEQGLAQGWGGHVKYETRRRTTDFVDERSALEFGVRRAIPLGDRSVVSIQGAYLGAEGLKGLDCRGSGYEMRGAAGASFARGDRTGYVNVEAAWRSRGSLCEGRLLEVAGGLDLSDHWRVSAKAWSDRSDGDASDKIEMSLFRDFKALSVGLGYRREVSGAFGESGWLGSVWTRF